MSRADISRVVKALTAHVSTVWLSVTRAKPWLASIVRKEEEPAEQEVHELTDRLTDQSFRS